MVGFALCNEIYHCERPDAVGKSLSEAELAAVEALLRDRPDGLAIRDLAGIAATEAQRRSMQRRLNKLISLGRARSAGASRSTRYFLADQPGPPVLLHQDEADLKEAGALFVPVSSVGQDLQKILRRPLEDREPVGYRREFLSSYKPNSTYYLSPGERRHLAGISMVEGVGNKPAGTYARQILNRLLIDLSWASSRLEGNTYSILDTHLLLEQGKVAEGKSAEETQMIINHKEAIEFLVDAAGEIGFNRHIILNLHSILAHNLLDPQAIGKLRQGIIGIGKSVYVPLRIPQVIEECFADLLSKAAAISDPFEQSFFVTVQIPYLQPFIDVNKRVSRLAANIPFIKKNLSPLSFIEVQESVYVDAMLAVYELNKTELARDMFIWAYERSARRYAALQQSLAAPDQFRLKFREELRGAVSEIVQKKLPKGEASKVLGAFASSSIPEVDRARFIEAAETELLGLHEGNFARFRLRPSQFFAWKAVWESA
jgi:Fic family protein